MDLSLKGQADRACALKRFGAQARRAGLVSWLSGRIAPTPASWHLFPGILQVFFLDLSGVFLLSCEDSPDSFSPGFCLGLIPPGQQRRGEDD